MSGPVKQPARQAYDGLHRMYAKRSKGTSRYLTTRKATKPFSARDLSLSKDAIAVAVVDRAPVLRLNVRAYAPAFAARTPIIPCKNALLLDVNPVPVVMVRGR